MFIGRPIVRKGDYCAEATAHFCMSGSNNVFANDHPVCRNGDNWSEGKKVIQGSKTVFANGLGVARLGDLVSCGFVVANGSLDVFTN